MHFDNVTYGYLIYVSELISDLKYTMHALFLILLTPG